jgi:hypothetical protein
MRSNRAWLEIIKTSFQDKRKSLQQGGPMKRKYVPILLLIGFIVAGVYGCGGGGGGGDVTVGSGPGAAGTTQALSAASSQVCASCHANPASTSPQVATVYADASGNIPAGSPTIVAEFSRSLHNSESAAACNQCHTVPAGANHPAANVNPDAQNLCLSCHSNLGLPHFNTAIVNTTSGFDGAAAAQYVDLTNNAAGQSKCVGCHNPHDTTTLMSLFREYSQGSGHGDVHGEGWIHYRWKNTTVPPAVTGQSSRAACQRCHTTTGFLAKINGELGLVGSARVPSYSRKYPDSSLLTVAGAGNATVVTFDVSGNAAKDNTKQVLRCDACHQDYSYKMRTPITVTAEYTNNGIAAGGTHTVTYPNIGKSNLCLNCHVGRENGDSVRLYDFNNTTGAAANWSNIGFVNSHYLTGGATVYTASGYEYATRGYANPAFYEHDLVGTAARPATGTGGPCVGCHMTPARHTFKPVTFAPGTRTITAVTSTMCVQCHGTGGFAANVANLTAWKAQDEAALEALNLALQARGFFFSASNPYFFNGPNGTGGSKTNWLSVGDADTTGNTTGKNNMGAAFNYNMLEHDYGAFAHNSVYVKRLIYDSIDWIDDNVLNDTVAATIAASTLTAQQKTDATAYLIPRP